MGLRVCIRGLSRCVEKTGVSWRGCIALAFEWAWLSGYEILWDQNEKNANPEAYWELVVARFGIPLIIFRYSMAKSHGC